MYQYKARVTDVYDGDTITVDIDLGFGIWQKGQKVRLHGINTPEIRGESRPNGIKARNWLRGRIENREVILTTFKDRKGKYGRWLADVRCDGLNMNEELVRLGFAEVVDYG